MKSFPDTQIWLNWLSIYKRNVKIKKMTFETWSFHVENILKSECVFYQQSCLFIHKNLIYINKVYKLSFKKKLRKNKNNDFSKKIVSECGSSIILLIIKNVLLVQRGCLFDFFIRPVVLVYYLSNKNKYTLIKNAL